MRDQIDVLKVDGQGCSHAHQLLRFAHRRQNAPSKQLAEQDELAKSGYKLDKRGTPPFLRCRDRRLHRSLRTGEHSLTSFLKLFLMNGNLS
jgi:hypothetical protein